MSHLAAFATFHMNCVECCGPARGMLRTGTWNVADRHTIVVKLQQCAEKSESECQYAPVRVMLQWSNRVIYGVSRVCSSILLKR